jgi:hypothetical protein
MALEVQNAHSQSIRVELQATKLALALPVGAHSGALQGLHSVCRLRKTCHIRTLPVAIKPRVSGSRLCCFRFSDSLPIGLLAANIYAVSTRVEVLARDACKA